MNDPLRYRIALRCYRKDYRETSSAELLAVLYEADRVRGRPSMKETASLAVGGVRQRMTGGSGSRSAHLLLRLAAVTLATSYALPDGAWTSRSLGVGLTDPVTIHEGPLSISRIVVPVLAFVLTAGVLSDRHQPTRRRRGAGGAVVVGFTSTLIMLASQATTGGLGHVVRQDLPEVLVIGVLASACGWTLAATMSRLTPGWRSQLTAGILFAVGLVSATPTTTRDALGGTYQGTRIAEIGPATAMATAGCALCLVALTLLRLETRPRA